MQARSGGEGQGSIFTVKLPLTAAAPPPEAPGSGDAEMRLDGVRVLSAGFQVHLPKPVQPAELASVVRRWPGAP